MSLYEHQSTYSPNLPLRFLFYVTELYAGVLQGENLYGTKRLFLDTPHFLIFYNGQEEMPERMTLRLSDAFKVSEREPQLELTATMLNINQGKNKKLMEASRVLREYAEYTQRVRENLKKVPLEEAVEETVAGCIRDGVLEDFLRRNRAEVKKLSIFEYDEKAQRRFLREEGREEGRLSFAEAILMLLEDLGEVPEGLRKRILEEENFDILKQVNRLTAHAENLEEFSQNYDDMMMRL